MRHFLLTRAVYGPSWDLEANRRRLRFSEGVTIRSIRAQTSQAFTWVVLVHPDDALLEERKAAFAGARFMTFEADDTPSKVAYLAYRADWHRVIGPRPDTVATTRLDDDDAFTPWAMERIETMAERVDRRAVLMFPNGIRVWEGRFTPVRHTSNAMQTLVTPAGDSATVYDYGHRFVRKFAPVRMVDSRIAWLWSRHSDTISGWRTAAHPLTATFRAMFPVDWSLFGEAPVGEHVMTGRIGRVFS